MLSYTEVAVNRIAAMLLVSALISTPVALGSGNSWNKIRYNGGTISAKVNPFDWNTSLTISPDAITLVFGHRTTVLIPPGQVTALSYGQEAHRRVADMVALSVVVTPLALFGLLHESKNHLVGIEYRTSDGKTGALLLEVDKNSYRAVLQMLKTVTGKPVQNAP